MNNFRLGTRDRRALVIGVSVVAVLFVLGKGLPGILAWKRNARAMTVQKEDELERASVRVRRSVLVSDSSRARGARMIALAPALLGGDSPATASATLAGIVSGAAARSNVRLGALQLRADTIRKGDFVRIGVHCEAVGDIAGITAMLAALEGGATLLAIRDLSITQPELAAPSDHAEALRLEMSIEGLMLRPTG